MKFNTAVEIILKHEGGYINHAKDPGGETNFGISKKSFPHVDIKNLTIEGAKEIYLNEYWRACKCDELPPRVRLIVFDGAVNQGLGATVGMLQASLGVKIDGVIGKETISKAWSYPEELIVEKLAVLRAQRYLASSKFRLFGAGWISRLIKVSVRTMVEE